jgi:hypothetical protein
LPIFSRAVEKVATLRWSRIYHFVDPLSFVVLGGSHVIGEKEFLSPGESAECWAAVWEERWQRSVTQGLKIFHQGAKLVALANLAPAVHLQILNDNDYQISNFFLSQIISHICNNITGQLLSNWLTWVAISFLNVSIPQDNSSPREASFGAQPRYNLEALDS